MCNLLTLPKFLSTNSVSMDYFLGDELKWPVTFAALRKICACAGSSFSLSLATSMGRAFGPACFVATSSSCLSSSTVVFFMAETRAR